MSQDGFVPAVDGAPLHYRLLGAGDPPLLLCDGVGCAGYAWRYLIESFRDRHRILHWHYRGHGLSGAPRDWSRLEIADLADDAARVMDHVGLEAAVLFGHSMGVQVILEIWRRHPDRVLGLVPICGSYGNVLDTFHGNSAMKTVFPWILKAASSPMSKPLFQAIWTATVPTTLAYSFAELVEINPKLVQPDDFRPYLEHLAEMDVEVFGRLLAAAGRHTAESYLAEIDVPTLVVAGEHDNFTPLHLSHKMAETIPGAEFQLLPTGTHTAPIELPDMLNLRVEKFLAQHFAGPIATAAAE